MIMMIDANPYSRQCFGQFQIAEVVLDENGDRSDKKDRTQHGEEGESMHAVADIVHCG
jgi:hypothetical protein